MGNSVCPECQVLVNSYRLAAKKVINDDNNRIVITIDVEIYIDIGVVTTISRPVTVLGLCPSYTGGSDNGRNHCRQKADDKLVGLNLFMSC